MASQVVMDNSAVSTELDKRLFFLFGALSGLGNELPYLNIVPGFGVFELLLIAFCATNPRGRMSLLAIIPLLMSVVALLSLCVSIFEGRLNYELNNLLYALRFSFFALVVFFFSGVKPGNHLEIVARGFVIGAAVQAAILWMQWFTEPRFFFGLPTLAFSRTFINPNSSGYLMSLGFLLSVFVKTNWFEKVAGVFLLGCVLATLSKGAWLASSLGLLYLVRKQWKLALFILLFTITLFFETFSTLVEAMDKRIMASSGSNEHRILMVERTVRAIQDYPLLGVGPGGWSKENEKYGLSGASDSHNVWMNLTIENGLVQGGLFFILFLTYGYCAVRLRSILAFGLFCHFSLYTLLIGLVYSDRSHWVFMALLFGLMLNIKKDMHPNFGDRLVPAKKQRILDKS